MQTSPDTVPARPKRKWDQPQADNGSAPWKRLKTEEYDPVDKVLGTTELLEAILLELDMKNLLFAQKVCRYWKAVIDSSVNIQKALFFLPRERRLIPQEMDVKKALASGDFLRLNPLIARREKVKFARSFGHGATGDTLLSNGILRGHNWVDAYLINMAKEASCHRMFVTRPPVEMTTTNVILTKGTIKPWRNVPRKMRIYASFKLPNDPMRKGRTLGEIFRALGVATNGVFYNHGWWSSNCNLDVLRE